MANATASAWLAEINQNDIHTTLIELCTHLRQQNQCMKFYNNYLSCLLAQQFVASKALVFTWSVKQMAGNNINLALPKFVNRRKLNWEPTSRFDCSNREPDNNKSDLLFIVFKCSFWFGVIVRHSNCEEKCRKVQVIQPYAVRNRLRI